MVTMAERKLKKSEAQERLVALIALGSTIVAALAEIGRTKATYHNWLAESDSFRQRVQAARRSGKMAREGKVVEESALVAFRHKYFGRLTPWHQREIINAIERAPGGAIVMILLPPEWGKTSVIEDFICESLGKNPNDRICVISASEDHAKKILGHVKRRMTDRHSYATYIDDYGPFKSPDRTIGEGRPWTADHFTVLKASHDERDYSVESKGAGASIYGARYDKAILDDIQSLRDLTKSEKLLEYFRQDVLTRVHKKGIIVFIGTRVGPGDIYERLEEEGMVSKIVRISALNDQGKSNFPPQVDDDGNPVLDARDNQLGWSEDDLAARRALVKDEIWDRVYMQRSGKRSKCPFTEEIVHNAKDWDRSIGDQNPGIACMHSVDPALGGVAAFSTVGYSFAKMWLLDFRQCPGLTRTEEIFATTREMAEKDFAHPSQVIFESNGVQKGFANDDRLYAMGRELGFSVYSHETHQNKLDVAIGVASMASSMERGEISIPWGDDITRAIMGPLCKQLQSWRHDIPTKFLEQDGVMSLWFSYLRWVQIRQSLGAEQKGWQRRPMPYTPTGAQPTLDRPNISGLVAPRPTTVHDGAVLIGGRRAG
jgi:hypothetical protein